MSREIKFRAWDKNNNVMSYPDGPMFTWYWGKQWLQVCSPFSNKNYKPFSTPAKPEDMIIMQFTGLLDKNGKEIYEGDIIKMADTFHEIRFGDYDNGWDYGEYDGGNGFYFSRISDKDTSGIHPKYWNQSQVEVVGNIHENQELMEGDKQ